MRTKMLAAAPTPRAPPTRMVLPSAQAKAPTTAGSTRQWNRSADSALITRISGRARKAKTNEAPGRVSSNGSGPPPK